MRKLFRFLKNYKKELILGPFFKLLEAIFELIVPIVMAKIIDNGIGNNDSDYILKMSIVIVILGICGLGFALTCQYLAAKCAFGFGTELRTALYKHINSLSYSGMVLDIIIYIINDTIGVTIRKITDNFRSMVIAITAAPMIRKGALTASLINIFTPP